MTREEHIAALEKYRDGIQSGGISVPYDDLMIALDASITALRGPQPDPDTGLVPCGWCGPERMGWFSVQFWMRASTGKRKWMSVTQKYKKQVNYCPMCGRKLEGRRK